ncbi:MAG: glycoside hydrolase family 31 protein [Arachidicoccus sp.]|nr:glycoside hydrolase family 31 protein [Arachidicoccus sp.]
MRIRNFIPLFLLFTFYTAYSYSQQNNIRVSPTIISVAKINATTAEIKLSNHQHFLFDFYGENIFRLLQDSLKNTFTDPYANPPAKILTDNPRKNISLLNLIENDSAVKISSADILIYIQKSTSQIKIFNKKDNSLITEIIEPADIQNNNCVLKLTAKANEYFYGGGVQNGRFSHKGNIIQIENQNNWVDGGVASPNPFYWSTNGYGFMWYTFKKGKYDFGKTHKEQIKLSHEDNKLDVFFMIDKHPAELLGDYYQLTGHPVLLPKFGFYEGHLNAYNRDYWKEDSLGILYENGKKYKESQKDTAGIKESLNGEKNNYQFSARAVIDRYKNNDLPLGWILPNDGYGAGYGQTSTLDGNIQNLKSFGDYARKNGVQIGLWTQSDLHPKKDIPALLQRDIIKEVGTAGVRVLKTDVAWVGAGYSFGLNGIADVSHIMSQYGNDARPFIISLDGWAGTQRYAGVWTGDQTGGLWEYIRFHIPTYIGSGLSGEPNITSDMDGIFGGKNPVVNIRDFEWKAFTPMQLNMDGWGANPKYPSALGEPATSINRSYLKLKSMLLPYTYSIAKQATDSLPMIRAMFLAYPNEYTYGKSTQYQYMFGPYFLVAPIYQSTQANANGDDIRNGIYLPKGEWIDYFSGDKYEGNCILNNFDAPLWKLPLFVKNGAIIPRTNPNNNVSEINTALRIYEIYPYKKSSFTEYTDDGFTQQYKFNKYATTYIESDVQGNEAIIKISPVKGDFEGFVKQKATRLIVNVTQKPVFIAAQKGSAKISLKEVFTMKDFLNTQNVYYYNAAPDLNQFATKGSAFEKTAIIKNPQIWINVEPVDITKYAITLAIGGFRFAPLDKTKNNIGILSSPHAEILDSNVNAFSVKPVWGKIKNADYYELLFNGQTYTTIKDTLLPFTDLTPETDYTFQIRAVNKSGKSAWSEFTAKTKSDPLRYAIKGITASTTAENQSGEGIKNLFDFDESTLWHTKWGQKAVPFDIVIDMHSINALDKIQYFPRSRGNGILLSGIVYYSNNKKDWQLVDTFHWANDDKAKSVYFTKHPEARYLKIAVKEGVNGFGSGRELYIFKVPESKSIIPGDINNDLVIDDNDLTSYLNYTGLRDGDADFEGYVSNGDVNKNGIIDAYDISNVAIQLEGGVDNNEADTLSGTVSLSSSKASYKKDETVELLVKGISLKDVNALSFAIPYNSQDYEYTGIQLLNMNEMKNMTNDRLHTNGAKELCPTFVNIGDNELLNGSKDLFIIKLKAKHDLNFNLKFIDGMLVDKNLNTLIFK